MNIKRAHDIPSKGSEKIFKHNICNFVLICWPRFGCTNCAMFFFLQLATTLAKQLVQLRKTKTRNLAASGKITAVGHQATAMQASHKMAGSMQTATKVGKLFFMILLNEKYRFVW